MEEELSCDKTREAIRDIVKTLEGFSDIEKRKLLHHLRVCQDCRLSTTREERGNAVHAIVSSYSGDE